MRSFWRVCVPGADRYACRKKGPFEIGPFDPFDYAPWAQAQGRLCTLGTSTLGTSSPLR